MQVNILLFANLKDIAGKNRVTITLPDGSATVDDVRNALIDLFPQISEHLHSTIAAVNQEYAFHGDPVNDGDEVAFFPPVSGGSGDAYPEVFQLVDSTVDHDEIVAAITTPATGAVCLFSGIVRGETSKEGHLPQVHHLEYEAYEPMALAKMQQVAAEIREKFPLVQGIAIVQRIGTLRVGQNTTLIACSSAHRDQGCFEAARYGIDRLKEIVPVWKKEVGADGQTWIEGEYTPTPADKVSKNRDEQVK